MEYLPITGDIFQTHLHENHALYLYGKFKPFGVMLDAGCGVGTIAREFKMIDGTLDPILLNPSQTQLDLCPDYKKICAYAEDIPLPDSSVDCIMVSSALCHMDIEDAFFEFYRLLKDGGVLFITDVSRVNGNNDLFLMLLNAHAFSREFIINEAVSIGFKLDYYEHPEIPSKIEHLFEDKSLYHSIFDDLKYTIWRFIK